MRACGSDVYPKFALSARYNHLSAFSVEPMYQLHLQSRTHGVGMVLMDSLINPRIAIVLGYLFMRGSPRVTFLTTLPAISDYPLTFEHGLAVFPLHHPDFSLNFVGIYDLTSYRFEDHTRLLYGGAAEYVVGPVPLRLGTLWDNRGKGGSDDRMYVSGGVAFVRPAKLGGVGVDAGFDFRQQVSGPDKETFLGFNVGIRIHPGL